MLLNVADNGLGDELTDGYALGKPVSEEIEIPVEHGDVLSLPFGDLQVVKGESAVVPLGENHRIRLGRVQHRLPHPLGKLEISRVARGNIPEKGQQEEQQESDGEAGPCFLHPLGQTEQNRRGEQQSEENRG